MPTQRALGRRKYRERLPEFKELDTDIPTAKNIEGSMDPLKQKFFNKLGTYTTAYSEKATLSHIQPDWLEAAITFLR